jgi:hypothetical protein
MLELASECRGLRAYVHVSSAFVNMNFPRHSLVHEKLYPLVHGDTVVTAESLVQVSGVTGVCWVCQGCGRCACLHTRRVVGWARAYDRAG